MSYKTWQVSTCLKQSCQFMSYKTWQVSTCLKQSCQSFELFSILFYLILILSFLFFYFSFFPFFLFSSFFSFWTCSNLSKTFMMRFDAIVSIHVRHDVICLKLGKCHIPCLKKWRSNSLDCVGKLAVKNPVNSSRISHHGEIHQTNTRQV